MFGGNVMSIVVCDGVHGGINDDQQPLDMKTN